MPDIDVADFDGERIPLTVNPNGRADADDSKPVAFSTEDKASVDAIANALENKATSALQSTANTALGNINTGIAALRGTEYEAVAASQTLQVLGATGAAGDLLESLLVVPTSLSPGAVQIRDGAGGTDIVVFSGGSESIGTLHPFNILIGARAASAGWRVTTGAGVSVFATGNFT